MSSIDIGPPLENQEPLIEAQKEPDGVVLNFGTINESYKIMNIPAEAVSQDRGTSSTACGLD